VGAQLRGMLEVDHLRSMEFPVRNKESPDRQMKPKEEHRTCVKENERKDEKDQNSLMAKKLRRSGKRGMAD